MFWISLVFVISLRAELIKTKAYKTNQLRDRSATKTTSMQERNLCSKGSKALQDRLAFLNRDMNI